MGSTTTNRRSISVSFWISIHVDNNTGCYRPHQHIKRKKEFLTVQRSIKFTMISFIVFMSLRCCKPFTPFPIALKRKNNKNLFQLSCYYSYQDIKSFNTLSTTANFDRNTQQNNGHCLCQLKKQSQRRWKSSSSVSLYRDLEEYSTAEELLVNGGIDTLGPSSAEFFSSLDEQQRRLFEVTAQFGPAGDQPEAIGKLTEQLTSGERFSVLQGITGTGKTLVMSHLIANVNQPCLVLCHNKTLAAQLARELRSFLKKSAVEFFVSYYNHYVPESFHESSGRYTTKKSSINNEIDALRHRATRALMSRDDVVVVSSVSCIYGLGLPKEFLDASMELSKNDFVSWTDLLEKFGWMQYTVAENDEEFIRGQYQVTEEHIFDENVEKNIVLWPPHEKFPMQIQLKKASQNSNVVLAGEKNDIFQVVRICEGNQNGLDEIQTVRIFPARHHVFSDDRIEQSCLAIEDELTHRLKELNDEKKFTEAERLQKRVMNDVYMMRETGFCSGAENYSRHFEGRPPLSPPGTLLDFMGTGRDGQPRNFLLIIDESHVTLPQLSAMYAGDQARKRSLVKHGYRLPSALDNRPLKADEFWDRVQQTVFVSATPSKTELALTKTAPVQMVIRPTYVCDPEIFVRPKDGQLADLLQEVKTRSLNGSKTLIVTLTKRDAEDLSSFLIENGVKCTFIHSGLTTHQRSNALRSLQNGEMDCLVGVNLLREGLDLPQVSLVAILNADSEGFLRCETSLLQTVGRAARNTHGIAIFYADRITESMKKCIDATQFRRSKQMAYNEKFGCEMRSTKGSSVLSIFDLLKDQIEAELPPEVGQKPFKEKGKLRKNDGDIGTSFAKESSKGFVTDHIPSSPGVYFWKDTDDNILYIGKASKLRSRVKSYLSPNANVSRRIQMMIKQAVKIDFILTPSERDALVLESNLIKFHQPNFNVLLKDDEHYPYICASIGDSIPRLFLVPQKHETTSSNELYRYYGPYTSIKEATEILEAVETKYELRKESFLVRHSSAPKEKYNEIFDTAIREVFSSNIDNANKELLSLRMRYEEAGLLFDSQYNECRDVVGVAEDVNTKDSFVVLLIQLRNGIVAGTFQYRCMIPSGDLHDDDFADAVETVLVKRHYPSAPTHNDRYSWLPNAILVPFKLRNPKSVQSAIRKVNEESQSERAYSGAKISTAASRGPKAASDVRALEFVNKNVKHMVEEKDSNRSGADGPLQDGTASKELAVMLSLPESPVRIECFDISHTQGEFPVASRVVFISGRPAPHLYRIFNIKPNSGGDDYASMEEVISRRFRRLKKVKKGETTVEDEAWARPDLIVIDGGKGQLSSAINGLRRASFDSNHLAICALAKNEEQVYLPNEEGPVNTAYDVAAPAMLLLRALRDESHRFALKAHRRRRSITKST